MARLWFENRTRYYTKTRSLAKAGVFVLVVVRVGFYDRDFPKEKGVARYPSFSASNYRCPVIF